jgi:hypothetical protein
MWYTLDPGFAVAIGTFRKIQKLRNIGQGTMRDESTPLERAGNE